MNRMLEGDFVVPKQIMFVLHTKCQKMALWYQAQSYGSYEPNVRQCFFWPMLVSQPLLAPLTILPIFIPSKGYKR